MIGKNVNLKDRVIRKTTKVKNKKVVESDNWQTGKIPVSYWLTIDLVEDLKIKAVKERKRVSRLVEELLRNQVRKYD